MNKSKIPPQFKDTQNEINSWIFVWQHFLYALVASIWSAPSAQKLIYENIHFAWCLIWIAELMNIRMSSRYRIWVTPQDKENAGTAAFMGHIVRMWNLISKTREIVISLNWLAFIFAQSISPALILLLIFAMHFAAFATIFVFDLIFNAIYAHFI